jgi:hypothetical protein
MPIGEGIYNFGAPNVHVPIGVRLRQSTANNVVHAVNQQKLGTAGIDSVSVEEFLYGAWPAFASILVSII